MTKSVLQNQETIFKELFQVHPNLRFETIKSLKRSVYDISAYHMTYYKSNIERKDMDHFKPKEF
jgi:hypothetical protein